MDDRNQKKEEFLYPRSKYYGKFTPEHLVVDANLQEFAQRVAYICGLENNGKISSADAYDRIKSLFKQLKQSKKELLNKE